MTLLPTQYSVRRHGVAALLFLACGACGDLLTVPNPDVIDATTLNGNDPLVVDVFARSAQTAFASSYGDIIRFGAMFTTEMQYVGTSEPEGQFAVRSVSILNLLNGPTVWGPLSSSRVQADKVTLLLKGTAGAESNINSARAALFSAYALELMAETFCEGTLADVTTLKPGARLTTAQVLDTAIVRYTSTIDIATAATGVLTGASLAEATSFVGAARVGRARAHLQRGNLALAIADAAAVPAGFTYSLQYVDDAGNRTRVSNRLWQFTLGSGQLSTAPAYRALADTRVPFQNPVSGLPAGDGTTLFAQQRYTSYSAPIRLASKLEGDYISAEAQLPNTAPALALIALRRTAGGQPAYAGGVDAASVLAELFDQRARDFFLEGHRLGDVRRAVDTYKNPALIKYMLTEGSAYFTKANLGLVGNQTCVPLPQTETANNPNFK